MGVTKRLIKGENEMGSQLLAVVTNQMNLRCLDSQSLLPVTFSFSLFLLPHGAASVVPPTLRPQHQLALFWRPGPLYVLRGYPVCLLPGVRSLLMFYGYLQLLFAVLH
uniref:Uncharacterized protein n=1 Tax=Micrurus corallinus TaxID=54390 RepID=A0A2D4FMA2_MICCO